MQFVQNSGTTLVEPHHIAKSSIQGIKTERAIV